MISIGNDIVALNLVNKLRTLQPPFYSKILSDPEQKLYSRTKANLPFEIYVWLLWSAKESVYKFLKRSSPDLIFSPTRIIVTSIELCLEPEFSGLKNFPNEFIEVEEIGSLNTFNLGIEYQGKQYFGKSIITAAFIATFVNDSTNFDQVYCGVKRITSDDYESQSQAVRAIVLTKLSCFFTGRPLQISKTTVGYPVAVDGTSELPIPLSFAHHGNYVSYAFKLPATQ